VRFLGNILGEFILGNILGEFILNNTFWRIYFEQYFLENLF
jgi:hypothetical protein